jgi:hypothetical protein
MRNHIKDKNQIELDKNTSRSVLDLNYRFLEMGFNAVTAHNMELLNTVHDLLEDQDNLRNNLRNGQHPSDNVSWYSLTDCKLIVKNCRGQTPK